MAAPVPPSGRTAARAAARAALLAALLAGAGAVHRADASTRSAHEAYVQGDYALAAKEYADSANRHPADARLQFNLGAAAYKTGDYPRAQAAFERALADGDIPLQQNTYYNLGNTLYRSGAVARAKDPQLAIKSWQQAVDAYDAALQLSAADADAKFNRDFVQKKLQELQRQQDQRSQHSRRNQQDQQDQQDQNQQQHQQGQSNQRNQRNQRGQQGGQDRSQQNQSQQNQSQQNQSRQDQQSQQNQPDQQNPQQSGQQGSQGQQNSGPGPRPQDAEGGQGPQQRPQGGGADTRSVADTPQPGRMTRSEAEQLLDSARGEEHHLVMGGANSKRNDNAPLPVRDW